MVWFLSGVGVFFFVIFILLFLVNVEEEKILFDKGLEIKNDELVLED